jgi:hypothetical protein
MREEIFDWSKYEVEGDLSFRKFIHTNYNCGIINKLHFNKKLTEEQIDSWGGISMLKHYNSKGVFNHGSLYLDKGFIEINFQDSKSVKGVKQNFFRIAYYYPDNYPQSKVNDIYNSLTEEITSNDYGVAILAQDQSGFKLIYQDTSIVEQDISCNYSKDFRKDISKIKHDLENYSKGLYLFSGLPGTGKTSFVNHLANTVNRQFIYIPNTMVNSLDNPSFINFLSDHSNSVLIIEDAEDCLKVRGTGSTGMVSTILNITDGLLGDILKISIVATYNADDKLIDPALLRKGRLKYKYYFDKLSKEEAQELADKQGLKVTITKPMTIGDIYNFEEESFISAPYKMGFA